MYVDTERLGGSTVVGCGSLRTTSKYIITRYPGSSFSLVSLVRVLTIVLSLEEPLCVTAPSFVALAILVIAGVLYIVYIYIRST